MLLGGWILLAVILGGTGLLMHLLYSDQSGAVPCCGCGQCVATGYCVMGRRKRAGKKEEHEEAP